MKTVKKLLSTALLAALLTLSALGAQAGMGNFKEIQSYPTGKFTDVAAGSWYDENVIAAYELGLMDGVNRTSFNPTGTITVAQSVTLAARIHSIYHTGSADFDQGSPWYQVYVCLLYTSRCV